MANPVPTPDQKALYKKLLRILMPYSQDQLRRVYPRIDEDESIPAMFAHYTSAEAALSIIENKRLWMRSTACMADFREINYGHDMLYQAFYHKGFKKPFVEALDKCHPGAAAEALKGFDEQWQKTRLQTYITCFSEHSPETENVHGRLSMWRAFSPTTSRVAIVIALPLFSSVAERIRVLFSPVGYLPLEGVCAELTRVIDNIGKNQEFFKKDVPRNALVASVYVTLIAAVTSLKHEGFSEEREWRALYSPIAMPPPPDQPMEKKTRVIGGVPQHVYELPIDGDVAAELAGIDLAKILDRIIIGPTRFAVYALPHLSSYQ
jgi:hypothetical protein